MKFLEQNFESKLGPLKNRAESLFNSVFSSVEQTSLPFSLAVLNLKENCELRFFLNFDEY
jgi:hypothetical protein